MIPNYYCFTRNGNCYAIDTVRIIPVQLSRAVYSTLQKMQDNKNDIEIDTLTDQEGFEDIQALANQDILFHNDNYSVENSFRELNISLIPTLGCNMNCKYCYSSRKNENKLMPSNIINDAINYFCNNFSFSFCRVDFVSGGEPLYDPESLVNMVDILSGTLDNHNKNTLFWLCTNGLLLNKQTLQYLDSKHFNLGISIDGPEDIHDANRVDWGGNGTYEKVVNKVLEVKDDEMLSRNIKNLWNCAVITSSTKSLVDIMSNSYQLGFQNLQMKIAWSSNNLIRLSDEKTIKLYDELTNHLLLLIEQKRLEEFLSICNENDTYGKVLLRVIIQSGVTRRCNAGVNKFSISPEGKLYPCDSFLGIEEFCIGDVYDGLNETYNDFSLKRNDNIEKCKSCWAKYLCGGDCFYHAYLNNGSPWVPDDQVCTIMKEITKMCISLVVDSYRSFPQEIQKVYAILSKKAIRMEPKS